MAKEFRESVLFGEFPQFPDKADETLYFADASSDGGDVPASLHCLEKCDVPAHSVIGDPCDGRLTDPAPGNIENTAHRDLVLSVLHSLKISDHVADLSAIVEIGSTDHIVGNRSENEPFLQRSCLRVGPVQDRKIAVMQISFSPAFFFNILCHESSFVPCCVKHTDMDLFSCALVRPERFVFSSGIVADHCVCGIKHILCRSVVLLQFNYQSVGIDLFKIQNVADICSAEAVDRLIVISDHAEISVFSGQKPYKFKLRVIGILVFVHHNIAETFLIDFQDFIVRVKKLYGQHEKIIKIYSIILAQPLLVFVVRVRDPLAAETHADILLSVLKRRDEFIFCR